MGKMIFWVGISIAILGVVIWLGDKMGLPFGRLPGDLAWKSKNFALYFPLATSLVVSLLLTVLLNLIFWFWRK